METIYINHIGSDSDGFERFDYSYGSYARSFYISPQEYEMKKLKQYARSRYHFSYRPITESDTGVDSRVAEILSNQYRFGFPIKDIYKVDI